MKWLRQIWALTIFNIKTIPGRLGSSLSAIFGIAGVVAVLVGVLSIAQGFRHAMTSSGSDDVAMVMRAGADSELTTILTGDDARILGDVAEAAEGESGKLVSPELFVVINLPMRKTGTDANVPIRGVRQQAFEIRPELEIVEGRMFEWGRNEVIVGRGAANRFSGLELGATIPIGQASWEVVGLFEADGSLPESEIWTDVSVLQPAYRRGNSYSLALIKLASAGSFTALKDRLTTDPRLSVDAHRESDYYREQSRLLTLIVTVLGNIIGGLMGVAAIFGALNTMYAAVAARTREIATLKALGFQSSPVVVSILLESLALAVIGGVVGGVLAMLLFNGVQTSTMNWQSFSQVAFSFRITPELITQGVIYASLIGLVGGLFPAIRAARLPVSAALRES